MKLLKRYSHLNWALLDQALLSGVNFLIGFFVARHLGLEEYGRFALAWLVVLFFASIQQAAIISPMISIGAQKASELRASYYGAIVVQQVLWSAVCVIAIIAGAALAQYTGLFLGANDLVIPLIFATVGFQFQDLVRRYLFCTGNSRSAFLNDLLCYGAQIAAISVGFSLFSMRGSTVLWIVGVTTLVATVSAYRSFQPLAYSFSTARNVAAEHWISAKWLTGASMIQWTSGNYLVVALGALVGPVAVGALRAAQNIMGVTHILFLGLENIVPAGAARRLHEDGREGLKVYLKKWGALCFVLTLIFCTLIAVNPQYLMRMVFGEEFSEYGYLLVWYGPVYLLTSLGLSIRAGLRALGKTRAIFIANSVAALLSLAVGSYLVKNGGLVGVMTGLICVQFLVQFLTLMSLRGYLK